MNEFKKIIIKSSDELTDIVSEIRSAKEDRIQLTFPEVSDLLISPISIKVLRDSADEAGKAMVFQIIGNRNGVRNATEAGVMIYEASGSIADDMWEMADTQMRNRVRKKEDVLKRTSVAAVESKQEKIQAVQNAEPDPVPTVETPEAQMAAPSTTQASVSPVETAPELAEGGEPSEFEARIAQALEKSKRELAIKKGKIVESDGLEVSLGHDVDEFSQPPAQKTEPVAQPEQSPVETTTEVDPSKQPVQAPKVEDKSVQVESKKPTKKAEKKADSKPKSNKEKLPVFTTRHMNSDFGVKAPQEGGIKLPTMDMQMASKQLGGLKDSAAIKWILKKGTAYLLIPAALIAAIVIYFIYTYTPLVTVKVYVEDRPVEVERILTGSVDAQSLDFEANTVPIIKREAIKESSGSSAATGIATRGEKASGVVQVTCGLIDGDSGVNKSLPAGTSLKSNDGLDFVLTSDAVITCPGITTAQGAAADFGAEYNIPSGTFMSVVSDSDLGAVSLVSFTGGSKEEYTVVSQEDYNNAVNSAKESAYSAGRSEIRKDDGDGWELIDDSLSQSQTGDIKADNAVGSEAEVVNVTVKTTTSALFYKRGEIETGVEQLLVQEAERNNLFESESDLALKLDDDITTEVTVSEVGSDSIKINLKASGSVEPEIDKDQIAEDLQGNSWDDGIKYLDNLDFVAQNTEVTFEPDYFPENYRYFPGRQGRILVEIKKI